LRKSNNSGIKTGSARVLSRARIKTVGFVFLVLFALVAVRLAKLMVFSDEKVAEYAQRQKYSSHELHHPRGVIYDRNMKELAISLRMKSIYINPKRAGNLSKTAWAMASELTTGPKRTKRLARKINASLSKNKNKYFVWIQRKAEPEVYASVKKANIDGVGFVDEYKRFYPKKDIAAKVIGFSGMDNLGLSGLEYYYDSQIHGVMAKSMVRKDALGRPVGSPEKMNLPVGNAPYDLVLTLDERIQFIAERALESKVLETGAKGGVVIVMDPKTGDILAIAEQPRFNPNNFSEYNTEQFKSHAISIPVEPGSTFKVFVTAAALEAKVLLAGELVDCENGRYTTGGKTFKEAHDRRFGMMPVSSVIAKSSNIGAIKIGEKLGPDRLYQYLRNFGFGLRTGVDLPAESPGTLREVSQWSQVSLPSISFGQEVAATPIQMAAGFSVFANGGYLVKPRVLKALTQEGEVVEDFTPVKGRRVLSQSTVKTMVGMMTDVVEQGTGKQAGASGFAVAGKTGTAQVFNNKSGAYSQEQYLSSFIGFFPAQDPALVVLVMINSPAGVAWGGAVAGPVFSEIVTRTARVLRMPGEGTDIYEADWAAMTTALNSGESGSRAGGEAI